MFLAGQRHQHRENWPAFPTVPALRLSHRCAVCCAAAPRSRQPGWRAGPGTPVFTPAPPRAAGRGGVLSTAKKRPGVGVPGPARHLPYRDSRRDGGHPGRWGPSRRPPPAGCAGLKTGVPGPARHLPYRDARRDRSHPGRWGPSRRPPPAGCAGLKTGVPFSPATARVLRASFPVRGGGPRSRRGVPGGLRSRTRSCVRGLPRSPP